ncbi:hypothetical protein RGQ29_013237 [Quercus rubra]|uniref:Uncharacterized protein n=1 Tax=Quercus rubra TaxID=3512 RepID=A0AAN7G6I9_QUERU|nr:hypothetical protein RGQ29_013237 [Quercus rubra]
MAAKMAKQQPKTAERTSILHQSNQYFVKRILSRDSSVGCSNRLYYHHNPGEVPFKWELKPGKAKNPQQHDNKITSTIDPPPAERLLGFSMAKKASSLGSKSKAYSWKKFKKNLKGKKNVQVKSQDSQPECDIVVDFKHGSDELDGCEFSRSDKEFMASSSGSRSSSSGSSSNNKAIAMHRPWKWKNLTKGIVRWKI